jgi:hypothetical protein
VVYREDINSYYGAADATIYQATPDINSGSCSYISVLTGSDTARSVIYFDVSALSGRTVVMADLRLYVAIGTPAEGTNVRLYGLTKSFSEGTECGLTGAGMVSWNSAGSSAWDSIGGDFNAVPISQLLYLTSSYVNPITFNLDPATVQAWIDNNANNSGMILKLEDESITGKTANFGSGEHINSSLRPQLRVLLLKNMEGL